MNNKKSSSVMIIKFLISTIIALLVFYFLMYRACSLVPFINDRAQSTMDNFEENVNRISSGSTTLVRQTLVLSGNKAFLFFENSSNQIKMYQTKDVFRDAIPPFVRNDFIYKINRPQYCSPNEACFCFCDELIKTNDERCNLFLECKRAKMVCKSFNETFRFQQDKEGFFNDTITINSEIKWYLIGSTFAEISRRLVFEGGFFISPKHNVIETPLERAPLVLNKDPNTNEIHICSRTGRCDFNIEARLNEIQILIDQGCS